MVEPGTSQPAPDADDADDHRLPTEEELAADAARVARAATELDVEVPAYFLLTGMGPDGKHTAFNSGTAADLRVGGAILMRLDGASVAECLAWMDEDDPDPGPRPEWMPPDDPNDAEAWDAWMNERARHPEWPDFYNGPGDWLPLLTSGAGITAIASAASYLKQRDRIKMAKWLVTRAEERGLPVDPVAVIRAFERSAPEPSATGTQGDAGQLPARPNGESDQNEG